MFEEICTFLGIEGAGNQADSATKSFDCSLDGLAQMRFHLAEALFDRIEVRRILRQISQARAHRFDCLAHASDLVSRKIVHDDGIAATERRDQALFNICDECWPVHRPVEDEGRDHSIVAQASYEDDGFPSTVRCVTNQANASWASAVEPAHLGAGGCLVDKHQARWVKHALLSNPTSSRAGDVGSSLLRGAQAFFLKVMLCRMKKRDKALRLPTIRRLRIAVTASSNVRSGCSAINANNQPACFSNGETLPPLGFAAQLPSARQRRSQLITELGLTSKSAATSCR